MTLDEWMKAKKFKDADVAERVEGLSRSQVNRIRRRKSIPPLSTARKLAVLTGLPVEAFVIVERAA
jgi:transcriptional regulator with XRE-family HTH domain